MFQPLSCDELRITKKHLKSRQSKRIYLSFHPSRDTSTLDECEARLGENMSINSFFDYPTDDEQLQGQDELIFLSGWPESRWKKLLAYTTTLRFKPDDILIRAGDKNKSFFIITEGELEVILPTRRNQKSDRNIIREAGSVIGEQAFIDGKPRSATVQAITKGSALQLSDRAFDEISAREPDLARDILVDIARLLSLKLRHANDYIYRITK